MVLKDFELGGRQVDCGYSEKTLSISLYAHRASFVAQAKSGFHVLSEATSSFSLVVKQFATPYSVALFVVCAVMVLEL